MQLVNFENSEADAVDELLSRVGLTMDLGQFLAEHLTEVFRLQHPDVKIRSIEFKKAHGCSGEGNQLPGKSSEIELRALCIPIDVRTVLFSSNRTHNLELHVRIMANALNESFDIKTDVIIQQQSHV
jgi:hypothetical protein